ncbi:hypothetical protein DERP_012710 [Dermatophagoides pteronyssinus]|uniref:Uncharacterized protein n=1 Tax=Dermatophagoides pteronyssinus TaxID=6956 RepID=A0ABQ8JQ39_DERPT|nr:hypothetical protein DERP_012710 [Dermatophagoides pteronyssinus]
MTRDLSCFCLPRRMNINCCFHFALFSPVIRKQQQPGANEGINIDIRNRFIFDKLPTCFLDFESIN